MKTTPPTAATTDSSPDADWQPWEEYVERLHEAARAQIEPETFYDQLLSGVVDVLGALGGAVWRRSSGVELQLLQQVNFQAICEPYERAPAEIQRKLRKLAECVTGASVHCLPTHRAAASPLPNEGPFPAGNPNPPAVLFCPVFRPRFGDGSQFESSQAVATNSPVQAVVALFQRPGTSSVAQQGGLQFLSTVCLVAADFEAFNELRRLRAQQDRFRQAAGLLQALSGSPALKQAASQVTSEGRRILACDRVSVLVPRGHHWQLLAVSGADPIQERSDLARQLRALAERTAHWGEVVTYAEGDENETSQQPDSHPDGQTEWPKALADILQRHIDQSHARSLVAVPLQPVPSPFDTSEDEPNHRPTAVLVAEQFSVAGSDWVPLARQKVVELATLCEPALRRALDADRFPVRVGAHVARWSGRLTTTLRLRRTGLVMAGLVGLIAVLVWLPVDYEVAATATLLPRARSELFAPCDGTVKKVLAGHGDRVAAGQVLAILDDPQLALDLQRVHGEIQTVLKQLEAVTASQTERPTGGPTGRSLDGLPLSAQEQQLDQQLRGLRGQLKILDRRRAALSLRSPLAGQVLTLDVQNLLESRPVSRGQVLFTVADTSSGWLLEAEVAQDRLGYLLRAAETLGADLPVRFRLAGDLGSTYSGRVEQIRSTAVLPEENLTSAAAPIGMRIRVDQQTLPYGRPGMAAEVRIGCGRRALGYVWLHDGWETVYRWLAF